MELVALVFCFLFAIIRVSFRASGEVTTAKKTARVGSWEEYIEKHCNRTLEKKYEAMVGPTRYFEEVWYTLERVWDLEHEKIDQMDERSQKIWELVMMRRRAPLNSVHGDISSENDPECRRMRELYKFDEYIDEWGNHQWVYNQRRIVHCLMTLHGKKAVEVATYEWAKMTCSIFDQPRDDLWTYDGRIKRAEEKRYLGLNENIEPLIQEKKW